MAADLEHQGADPFRVMAYRRAAHSVDDWPDDLRTLIAEKGAAALQALPGVGRSLAEKIAALAETAVALEEPPLALLLEVDEEYRRRAAAGDLPRIAPRQHNPHHAAWLPVLQTRRGPWSLTALFSNSDQAHALHRTSDWVVLHYHRPGQTEGHCTVVTDGEGKRVVRGVSA
jgi:hypothetical protein